MRAFRHRLHVVPIVARLRRRRGRIGRPMHAEKVRGVRVKGHAEEEHFTKREGKENQHRGRKGVVVDRA